MHDKLSLNSKHFKQYKEIAPLLLKLWKGAKVEKEDSPVVLDSLHDARMTKSPAALSQPIDASPAPSVAAFVQEVERLGPTYIRLAQLLALRPNLLPMNYIDAIPLLGQTSCPMSYLEAKTQLEIQLGYSLDLAFESFYELPIAVSPFNQIHKAKTRDGAEVVVKIQKPGVKEKSIDDLDAMNEMAQIYDKYSGPEEEFEVQDALQDFKTTILAELDYRQEAHNLKTMAKYLKHLDGIIIPSPIDGLSGEKVLTVRFIKGDYLSEANMVGLLKSERAKLAEQVFTAYLQQFLVDGFVHADPSPQKLMLTKDGKLALVNLSTVDRINPTIQAKLIQLLLSITEARTEQATQLILSICKKRKGFDETRFRRTISDIVLTHRDIALEQSQVGSIFRGIVQASAMYGVSLPWELSELGTMLIKLEAVARVLDPKFDSNLFVKKAVGQIMHKHMLDSFSPAHVFHTVVEAFEFVENLPNQISQILTSLANNNLEVTVHTINEEVLIGGFQKIANRITVGIVLAALIIGAAMLMRVPTNFTIFGYPGLAMILFMAAAGFGFLLVIEIFFGDRRKSN